MSNFLSAVWWKNATIENVRDEISAGADVDAENLSGKTALGYAYEKKNYQVIELLKKYRAI